MQKYFDQFSLQQFEYLFYAFFWLQSSVQICKNSTKNSKSFNIFQYDDSTNSTKMPAFIQEFNLKSVKKEKYFGMMVHRGSLNQTIERILTYYVRRLQMLSVQCVEWQG